MSVDKTVLKPCPFCGNVGTDFLQYDEDGEYAALFCTRKSCRASSPVVDTVRDENDEYDEDATFLKVAPLWNTRA